MKILLLHCIHSFLMMKQIYFSMENQKQEENNVKTTELMYLRIFCTSLCKYLCRTSFVSATSASISEILFALVIHVSHCTMAKFQWEVQHLHTIENFQLCLIFSASKYFRQICKLSLSFYPCPKIPDTFVGDKMNGCQMSIMLCFIPQEK